MNRDAIPGSKQLIPSDNPDKMVQQKSIEKLFPDFRTSGTHSDTKYHIEEEQLNYFLEDQ